MPIRRRRGVRVAAALVAGGFVATLVGGALATGGRGGETASSTSTTTTTTSPRSTSTTELDRAALSAEAQELLALIDRGRGSTYHARYTIRSSSLSEGAAVADLEVWRSGQRIRQDTTFEDASGFTRASAFGDQTGTITCRQRTGEEWDCQPESPEPHDPTDDFVQGVLELLADATVTVTDATVGPFAGRCFVLQSAQRAEVCIDTNGVPLRIDAGGSTYEASVVDAIVTDADFVPPA